MFPLEWGLASPLVQDSIVCAARPIHFREGPPLPAGRLGGIEHWSGTVGTVAWGGYPNPVLCVRSMLMIPGTTLRRRWQPRREGESTLGSTSSRRWAGVPRYRNSRRGGVEGTRQLTRKRLAFRPLHPMKSTTSSTHTRNVVPPNTTVGPRIRPELTCSLLA